MANMWSEYVDWLILETFLHPESKSVFFAFQHVEVDFFFVLNLLYKIPQFQVCWEKVNFEAQIWEYDIKVIGILISIIVGY